MTRKRRRIAKVLDTNVLIDFWRLKKTTSPANRTVTREMAREWGCELVDLEGTRFIVTPVCLEFLAGVRSSKELELAREYLACFEILDEGCISAKVWESAMRRAERIPPDGKPRHLGDCLVRAIAEAHHCDVVTRDATFPR